jgi:hypothetical protein
MPGIQNTLQSLIDDMGVMKDRIQRLSNHSAGGGYWVPLPFWLGTPGSGYAATTVTHVWGIPRALTVRKFAIQAQTQTTNNAGNHWTVKATVGSGGTMLAAQSMEADTINTWTSHVYITFTLTDFTPSDDFIAITATKVGAPGTFFLLPSLLFI